MDEKTLRVHLNAVFRGAAIVAVLTILRTIAFKLLGVDTMVGSLNAGGYIFLALTIAILFVLVRSFFAAPRGGRLLPRCLGEGGQDPGA